MPTPPPPPPPARRAPATGSHPVYRARHAPAGTDNLRPSDFEHFARINAAGELTQGHGSAEQLAALSAFACSVVDGVGQLLGLGATRSVEARFAGGALLTMRQADGSIIGLKPRGQGER
jgi:hypothetical protein